MPQMLAGSRRCPCSDAEHLQGSPLGAPRAVGMLRELLRARSAQCLRQMMLVVMSIGWPCDRGARNGLQFSGDLGRSRSELESLISVLAHSQHSSIFLGYDPHYALSSLW